MPLTPDELKRSITGLLSFPVTPFDAAGEIDLPRYREHVEYMIAQNPGALFVCGGTGEFFSLDLYEYRRLVRAAAEVAGGRLPIVAGVGYGMRIAANFARAAEEAGADGVMVMPPYLVNAEQEGLAAHYRHIAEEIDIGVIVYQRDNAVFQPDTVARLAAVDNIVGLKDGHGDIERLYRIRLAIGDRLVIINGMPTAELSAAGLKGVGVRDYSSAVFNFVPEVSRAFYSAYLRDDGGETSRLMQAFYLPFAALRDRAKGYAVSLVKAGVSVRLGDAGQARPPLVNPSAEERERLSDIIRDGLEAVG